MLCVSSSCRDIELFIVSDICRSHGDMVDAVCE
jgi:hypothetical protein